MPSSTGSDRSARPGALRRLHALRLELPEWLAILTVSAVASSVTGYNLAQFALYGRLYVMVRHADNYWAYWRTDAGAIAEHGLWTLVIFMFSVCALVPMLIYPFLILLWGKTSPGYKRLPPLSIKD
ncbi:hypothetical protein BH10PSE4_BH10PSE4_25920 [soil metagenome]